MNARTITGIIVGILSWWAVFLLSLFLSALLWPALAEAGRRVQEANDYSALTTGMLASLLGMYVYINGIAGWVTTRIARRSSAFWIAGAPIVAYAAYDHLYVLWDQLPGWYNVGVVGFVYPLGFLGGSLARKRKTIPTEPPVATVRRNAAQ